MHVLTKTKMYIRSGVLFVVFLHLFADLLMASVQQLQEH